MADVPTIEDLKKLRVVDLKERLQAAGLTIGGLKADLVERLHQHHVKNASQMAPNVAPTMPPGADLMQQQHQMLAEQQQQQQLLAEQQRHQQLAEQQRQQLEQQMQQQMLAEQQQQQQMLADQQQQQIAAEQQRQLAEQQQQHMLAEQQQLQHQQQMAAEQQRQQQMLAEQQQQQMAAEQQRQHQLAAEQQQQHMLAEQQQQQMLAEQQMLMEQQRQQQLEQQRQQQILAEQEKMIAEQQQQQMMAAKLQQQQMMAQQQQMLEEQQRQQHLLEQREATEKQEQARILQEQQRKIEEQQRAESQQPPIAAEQEGQQAHLRLAQQQAAMLEQEQQVKQQALLQSQLLAAEEQQKQQELEILDQQKQAMAMHQNAMIEQERQQDMINKALHQQQIMEAERQQALIAQQQAMEAEKQAEILRQQQAVMEQQQKEAEMLRQQQIALIEQQKEEELLKQRQEEQRAILEEQARQSIPPPIQPPVLTRPPVPPQMPAPQQGPPVGHMPPRVPHPVRPMAPPPRMSGPPMDKPPSLMSIDVAPPLQFKANDDDKSDIKLPQALEKVLAFKDVRAQEIQQDPENVTFEEVEEETPEDSGIDQRYYDDSEEKETSKSLKEKESKNRRRKKKKKKRAKERGVEGTKIDYYMDPQDDDIEIEYVQEELNLDRTDPQYHQFAKIFQAFKLSEPEKEHDEKHKVSEKKKEDGPQEEITKGKHLQDLDEEEHAMKDAEEKPKVSKKKLKKLNRLSVAELKQLVSRPDVVEMHDVTATDPKLLVHLKATRNSVSVPRHWCFKRKYLQGKRGIEKAPFDLPDYIKATGIMEMREALAEKEDQKTLKSKMREKIRPKMGKIDIDYQKLHDAFFRWQTKPKLTMHGDLYYEGKEFETKLKEKKPGNLSDDIRTALGMPVGSTADKFPPPWLIAMQRYGPPPSYPNLKIVGLNAPIPESCSFGYHAGGWGKPPVDENGKPLYGDVFGTQGTEFQTPVKEDEIDRTLWGELESESESESEAEDESDEEKEEADKSGLITPGDAGLVTPSGITSMPAGLETPDMIEIRKKNIEDQMEGGDTPALYTVLSEKKTQVGTAMMGSAHVYDMAAPTGKKAGEKSRVEGVEVSLNPEELDLDTAAMQAKYEQRLKESQLEKEDLSDMVAEHAAKQKKRKKQQQDGGKSKKYKEFKF